MTNLGMAVDPLNPARFVIGSSLQNRANGKGAFGIYQIDLGAGVQTVTPVMQADAPTSNHPASWGHHGMQISGQVESGQTHYYFGIGDAKAAPDAIPSQYTTSPWGKLHRIFLGADDLPDDPWNNFGAADNPDYGTNALPSIFSIGFRNPFRSTIGCEGTCLLVFDVGENTRETVWQVPIGPGQAPTNAAWPGFEGGQPYNADAIMGPGDLLSPLAAYGRTSPDGLFEGQSIIGGDIATTGPLDGSIVFGDLRHFRGGDGIAARIFTFDPETGIRVWRGVGDGLKKPLAIKNLHGDLTILNRDGGVYRLQGIEPAAVPLPAGVWLLMAGIGGVGLLRRRCARPVGMRADGRAERVAAA